MIGAVSIARMVRGTVAAGDAWAARFGGAHTEEGRR